MKKYGFYVLLIFALFSCKKESNDKVTNDYSPQKVGNYWIYETVKVFPDGTEDVFTSTDSITIVSDTLIRGEKFYISEGVHFEPFNNSYQKMTGRYSIARDSSGYLIESSGRIIFSNNNDENILFKHYSVNYTGDTLFSTSYQMENTKEQINTKAGTFDCKNYQGKLYYISLAAPEVSYPLIYNNFYAKNIGLVKYTCSFCYSCSWYVEKRLVRYKIY